MYEPSFQMQYFQVAYTNPYINYLDYDLYSNGLQTYPMFYPSATATDFLSTMPQQPIFTYDNFNLISDGRESYNFDNISNVDYHVSRGFALLVFNDTFIGEHKLPFTQNDMAILVDALNSLNFTIEVRQNLTAIEIDNLIKYYATNFDFTGYDCFFCIVSSHGDKSVISGTDSQVVKIDDTFLEPLYNCQTLYGKPKILVFNACRGHQEPFWKFNDNTFAKRSLKDFFIAFATLEGYVSGGLPYGSFFLQSLGNALKKFGHFEDLNTIFTRVNRYVEAIYDYQIPEFHSRLKSKVYLR